MPLWRWVGAYPIYLLAPLMLAVSVAPAAADEPGEEDDVPDPWSQEWPEPEIPSEPPRQLCLGDDDSPVEACVRPTQGDELGVFGLPTTQVPGLETEVDRGGDDIGFGTVLGTQCIQGYTATTDHQMDFSVCRGDIGSFLGGSESCGSWDTSGIDSFLSGAGRCLEGLQQAVQGLDSCVGTEVRFDDDVFESDCVTADVPGLLEGTISAALGTTLPPLPVIPTNGLEDALDPGPAMTAAEASLAAMADSARRLDYVVNDAHGTANLWLLPFASAQIGTTVATFEKTKGGMQDSLASLDLLNMTVAGVSGTASLPTYDPAAGPPRKEDVAVAFAGVQGGAEIHTVGGVGQGVHVDLADLMRATSDGPARLNVGDPAETLALEEAPGHGLSRVDLVSPPPTREVSTRVAAVDCSQACTLESLAGFIEAPVIGAMAVVALVVFAVFWRLYSRLDRVQILELPIRNGIMQRIRSQRCVTAGHLARECGVAYQTVLYHLQLLEREGMVRRVQVGASVFWSDPASKPDQVDLLNSRAPVVADLWNLVVQNPGQTTRDLADGIGLSPRMTRYYLEQLCGAGKVEGSRMEDRSTRWVAAGTAGGGP